MLITMVNCILQNICSISDKVKKNVYLWAESVCSGALYWLTFHLIIVSIIKLGQGNKKNSLNFVLNHKASANLLLRDRSLISVF